MIKSINKVFIAALIILSVNMVNAQINAITDTGDEVILFQDGTWNYLNDSLIENVEIPVNDFIFIKDESSTFLVKSKRINIGIWINPKEWSFSKGAESTATELQFQSKGGDLYGMLISEKLQIPLETLREIAIQNAKSAAPDLKVLKEEYRTINGIQVLMLSFSGTIQGIKFKYYCYYYSNDQGSIQLLTYTGNDIFDDKLEAIESFLNGFVVL